MQVDGVLWTTLLLSKRPLFHLMSSSLLVGSLPDTPILVCCRGLFVCEPSCCCFLFTFACERRTSLLIHLLLGSYARSLECTCSLFVNDDYPIDINKCYCYYPCSVDEVDEAEGGHPFNKVSKTKSLYYLKNPTLNKT